MASDLQQLKFVRDADVYKNGVVAGRLARTDSGGVEFTYRADYLVSGLPPVAASLPLSDAAIEAPSRREIRPYSWR